MLVLLTNDDGIDAAGLEALAAAVERQGHETWIVAPETNQSGISHGITIAGSLKIKKIKKRVYSCSGKPVDCVIAAFDGLLPQKPDIVLSGINFGANIGTDVVFSGTAAAARQAAIHGVPAAAVSLVIEEGRAASSPQWDALADFAASNLEALASVCGEDIFANINATSAPSYKGFKITSLCRRIYHDTMRFFPAAAEGGNETFKCVFEGGTIEVASYLGDDWDAIKSGYISVSPVSAQPWVLEDMRAAFRATPFSYSAAQ